MVRAVAATLLFTVIPATLAAQNKPRTLQIQGPQAFSLISLLVSGSNSIAVDNGSITHIALHDLFVKKSSTFKYDEDSSMYKLDVYSARAKIGAATQETSIGEATALFELLSSLGVTPDAAMEGTYLEAQTVDCRINAHVAFEKPQRFVCELSLPF